MWKIFEYFDYKLIKWHLTEFQAFYLGTISFLISYPKISQFSNRRISRPLWLISAKHFHFLVFWRDARHNFSREGFLLEAEGSDFHRIFTRILEILDARFVVVYFSWGLSLLSWDFHENGFMLKKGGGKKKQFEALSWPQAKVYA